MAKPVVSRYRKSTWFDTKRQCEVFGIKAKVDGRWCDAGDNGGVLFFDKAVDRDEKLRELNAELKAMAA